MKTEMKIMTEEELRAIDPEEFEGKEYPWKNDSLEATVVCVYEYDIGLSLVNTNDHEDCFTGIPGPNSIAGNAGSYEKSHYHKQLTISFNMLRKGQYNVKDYFTVVGGLEWGGAPTCSFS